MSPTFQKRLGTDVSTKRLSMYRLHEVDGLRTRIEDCAELALKSGEECDIQFGTAVDGLC